MTNAEKYGHEKMSAEDLEARIAADMYELAQRLEKIAETESIGVLIWKLMRQLREAYRTAKLVVAE